jgi:hypothetical protein
MWKPDSSQIITAEQKQAEALESLTAFFSQAIQTHLDSRAQERRYDSIQTAVTYRDDPNTSFAAEGGALFAWRSAVWTYALAELAKVQAGQRDIPTTADFIAELPPLVWPA